MDATERVACPWCAEQIMPTAIVCPHCQRNTGFVKPPEKEPSRIGLTAMVVVAVALCGLALLVVIAGVFSAMGQQ